MKRVTIWLAAAAIVGLGVAQATESRTLGYSDEVIVIGPGTDECTGDLFYNHDGSFENGACWQFAGIVSPYYGAFGETFDLGDVYVECMAIWVSQIGNWTDQSMDLFVWEGGVSDEPGPVMAMFGDRHMYNVPYWPTAGQNDFEVCITCSGEFTVGYWGHFADCDCGWYTVADFNDSPGHAWTCVAPGIGYPSGWQHPRIIWSDPFNSLGFGVYIQDTPSPREAPTWGSIKELFD